ncbi:MAG TPA: hypothetical protein VKB57_12045 [Acidimicrobiales bacterium]|nr:hypothetical protein [Acidimicrobiales bacterium]
MSTTPPPPSGPPPSGPPGEPEGFPTPPPAPQGPWASDSLPPHPTAAANQVEQPPSIRLAVRLMWLGAVVTVLGSLSVFVQTDALRDRLKDNDATLTKSDLDAAVAAIIGFTIVIGLVIVALWLWMAYTNGQGKSWARVVATVLGVLNVLFLVGGLAMGNQTGLGLVFNFVNLVLAIVILVLLYRPDSSSYYQANAV